MKAAEKFLLLVYVHESQAEVVRLLESIEGNPSLRDHPLLVVNNALTPATIDAISQVCASFPGPHRAEVSRHSWPSVRSAIVGPERAERGSASDWLFDLELGQEGWSVHNARNIGLIASRALFPECDTALHLDSDIVVPKEFALEDLPATELTCLQIDGCPDLSRLEWLALYTFCLARKCSLSHPAYRQQYSLELTSQLPPAHVQAILGEYTDVPLMWDGPVCVGADGAILSFPSREEYHGACFIASRRLLEQCPFPCWFDNDWFVFQELRVPGNGVEFLPQRVTHQSARKRVFDRAWLLHEEEGKILNGLHKQLVERNHTAENCLGRAIRERIAIIEGLLELAQCVGESRLTVPECAGISRTITALEHLLTDVWGLKADRLLDELRSFYSFRQSWQAWFNGDSHSPNYHTPERLLHG